MIRRCVRWQPDGSGANGRGRGARTSADTPPQHATSNRVWKVDVTTGGLCAVTGFVFSFAGAASAFSTVFSFGLAAASDFVAFAAFVVFAAFAGSGLAAVRLARPRRWTLPITAFRVTPPRTFAIWLALWPSPQRVLSVSTRSSVQDIGNPRS